MYALGDQMFNWKRFLHRVVWEVYTNAKPILGTEKAGETVGRGAGGDITKQIDYLAENIVINLLKEEGLSCLLVSEECGTRMMGDEPKDYLVLDSIDGTTNAVRGISFASVSLAHSRGPRLRDIDVGVVMDLFKGTVFTSEKGKGSKEEGDPMVPSQVKDLKKALIGIDLPLKTGSLSSTITRLMPLMAEIRKYRHLGSTALEVCYVASGRLEAFIDLEGITRATDLAAAYLIVKEAGGLIASPDGDEVNLELKETARTPFIAAANPELLNKILLLLRDGS
jgi:myo-inositol-1(or 4)-monophosphatase